MPSFLISFTSLCLVASSLVSPVSNNTETVAFEVASHNVGGKHASPGTEMAWNKNLAVQDEAFRRLRKEMLRQEEKKNSARNTKDSKEVALQAIHAITTNNMGSLCVTEDYRVLPFPLPCVPARFQDSRRKGDMASAVIKELGINHRDGASALANERAPEVGMTVQPRREELSVPEEAVAGSGDAAIASPTSSNRYHPVRHPTPLWRRYKKRNRSPPAWLLASTWGRRTSGGVEDGDHCGGNGGGGNSSGEDSEAGGSGHQTAVAARNHNGNVEVVVTSDSR